MKRPLFLNYIFLGSITLTAAAQGQDVAPRQQIPLPTSKMVELRSSGRIGFVNSFPTAIAVSPDGRFAALLNDGYGTLRARGQQSITVLDLRTSRLKDFPDQRFSAKARQSYFLGLAFSSDGQYLYASVVSLSDPTGTKRGDTGNGIAVYRFDEGKPKPARFIKLAPQSLAPAHRIATELSTTATGRAIPYPAGLAVVSVNSRDELLIADNLSDNVVLVDSQTGSVLRQFDLSTNRVVPGSFPYTVVVSRDGQRAWCSLWNASKIAQLDLASGRVVRWTSLLAPTDATDPGSHPTALLLSPDEKLLYVTLSNADALAVIDTVSGAVTHVSSTQIPHQQYPGSYPNALAQSDDGKRVFVADASLNAIAVFDRETLATPKSPMTPSDDVVGFIPTDWYPSALAVSRSRLLVAAAKGKGVPANSETNELKRQNGREHPFIPNLLYGSIAAFELRDLQSKLSQWTLRVQQNNLLFSSPGKIEFLGGRNPIRHVIYILKENRAYDQILGDLTLHGVRVGNGDASLTMYGEDVTPNEHKLALEFGVLDNFYDSGEVSGDGHEWSNAAITSDYNEKTWQIAYRGGEHTYDYGGIVAGEIPVELGEANVDSPGSGFIWDNLARHKLSYRDYGEYVTVKWCSDQRRTGALPTEGTPSPLSKACDRISVGYGDRLPACIGNPHGSASPWPWNIPLFADVRPTMRSLRDHIDSMFPDFNLAYPDQLRADEFLNEFSAFVRARREGHGTELPSFVLLYLPNDHTWGTAKGFPRPAASVADNDLAVGRVVDAISHSPYWDDSAIFIVEDDASDGADHVDAHRSVAFVVSKYSPSTEERPFVDSRFYTTVNMVHTMESLLGLPPMNQNDAYAPVMTPLLTGPGDHPAFTADWRNLRDGLIYQMNPAKRPGAEQSSRMNFTRPDAANATVLNRILWRDRKGDVSMPAPKHTFFPTD